jgi:probable rRNA maturation factor
MPVFIEVLERSSPVPQEALRRLAGLVLRAEGYAGHRLTLVLSDSARLRRLNRKYRGRDRVTDVISFAMLEGRANPAAARELGDIYISIPRARKQARQYRVSFPEELRRLVVHGLLHLLGYDHIRSGPAARMRQKEELYLGQARRPRTDREGPRRR